MFRTVPRMAGYVLPDSIPTQPVAYHDSGGMIAYGRPIPVGNLPIFSS
jgi:hypothetical protein